MAKYMQIKEQIIERLRGMTANQRFLSRNLMCSKYEISRSTADKIVAELIDEGYMYTTKGSGTYVASRLPAISTPEINSALYSWGVIMPDVRYFMYPDMFSGIEKFARAHNINIFICNTDDEAEREHAFIQRLIASNVDGLIIVPSYQMDLNNYRYILERQIPFVFWNRCVDSMPNVPQVCISGYHGGLIATRHLLQKGYDKVAYIAPKRFRSSMDRFFGYCSALEEDGRKLKNEWVCLFLENEQPAAIKACALSILSMEEPPNAFLCFVDKMAVGICQAIEEMGLQVSDDIGLIGFESSITTTDAEMTKKLTYVAINGYESGWRVAEILYELMHENKMRITVPYVVQPKLNIRDTCLGLKHNKNIAAQ